MGIRQRSEQQKLVFFVHVACEEKKSRKCAIIGLRHCFSDRRAEYHKYIIWPKTNTPVRYRAGIEYCFGQWDGRMCAEYIPLDTIPKNGLKRPGVPVLDFFQQSSTIVVDFLRNQRQRKLYLFCVGVHEVRGVVG